MSDEARFWNKRAKKYALRPVADQETYEKKIEITRAYFQHDSEVLEIGCGTGSTALAHAPKVGHILATDISPAMIDIARAKAKESKIDNVSFETRAAANHDIPASFYDVVMAHNLLHLLEDPGAVVKAAYRGLKPGGAFVTSTACIGDMSWYFRIIAAAVRLLRIIPFLQVFTQAKLKQSFIDAGFAIDHEWLPKKNAAAFIVAVKPDTGGAARTGFAE